MGNRGEATPRMRKPVLPAWLTADIIEAVAAVRMRARGYAAVMQAYKDPTPADRDESQRRITRAAKELELAMADLSDALSGEP